MWCTEEEHRKLVRRYRTVPEFVIQVYGSCTTPDHIAVAENLHKSACKRAEGVARPGYRPLMPGPRRATSEKVEDARKEALERVGET